MDALEFLREHKRMCNHYEGCCDCPLEVSICPGSSTVPDEDYKKLITVVEHWSAAHQHKTRQEVFLEQYPNVKCNDNIVAICPKVIDISFSCPIEGNIDIDCSDCLHKFWMHRVK